MWCPILEVAENLPLTSHAEVLFVFDDDLLLDLLVPEIATDLISNCDEPGYWGMLNLHSDPYRVVELLSELVRAQSALEYLSKLEHFGKS